MSIPPKAKKKTTSAKKDLYPSLPSPITKAVNQNYPKFIIIKSSEENNKISKDSVFAKKKALDGISTEYSSVSILKDGSLLVLTKSKKVAEKFMKCKNLGGLCPISVSLHESLNTCKGTIYDKNLAETDEKEIIEGLKSQGVVDIYKFTEKVNGNPMPTGRMVLTFDLYKVLQDIDVAWYSLKVEEHFPTPMRCRNCQLLGHSTKECNNNTTCEICNLPPHTPELCQRKMCANCFGPHPASARDCPKYLEQKQILKIKTQNKCNFYEAKRLFKLQNPFSFNGKQTYASAITSEPSPVLLPSTTAENSPSHSISKTTTSDTSQNTANSINTNKLPALPLPKHSLNSEDNTTAHFASLSPNFLINNKRTTVQESSSLVTQPNTTSSLTPTSHSIPSHKLSSFTINNSDMSARALTEYTPHLSTNSFNNSIENPIDYTITNTITPSDTLSNYQLPDDYMNYVHYQLHSTSVSQVQVDDIEIDHDETTV
ncbi:uncharacterized protein LOC128870027 [Anastrepha ludens]|uniref:uncharacterized protein LOC128870027 n=1 Tax=Anastrepha ludens TaxID=28586 RepID=UPI0023AED3B1|nr:uncharacterized protein LOC128870027 [Anastrepha ludens]